MEGFDITIDHCGATKSFQRFGRYGWSYRFIMDIEGTEVIVEPDEEKNLRAVLPSPASVDNKLKELVGLVAADIRHSLISTSSGLVKNDFS